MPRPLCRRMSRFATASTESLLFHSLHQGALRVDRPCRSCVGSRTTSRALASKNAVEAVLLMKRHSDVAWTAAQVSVALVGNAEVSATLLAELVARVFLARLDGADDAAAYLFRPRDAATRSAVVGLARPLRTPSAHPDFGGATRSGGATSVGRGGAARPEQRVVERRP